MYQLEWADEHGWAAEPAAADGDGTGLAREDVAHTLLVHWQEHCIECAPPDCYAVCPLYVQRGDLACARFAYGVYPNERFAGLLPYGADVRFRRWGKLETRLYGKRLSVRGHRFVALADRALARVARLLRAPVAYASLRERALRSLPLRAADGYDEFVLECYSPDPEPFRLVLEYEPEGRPALRHAFDVRPGHNRHAVPAARFGPLAAARAGRLLLYPENDAERRLVFTWLDFVRYRSAPVRPAEKLKCVAWDLDNTLWEGTLIEDGPAGCRLRPEAAELVRALDERGILQTVVSKNDHDEAWALVTELGLDEFFLHPAINWGRKSESLRAIAERLNIGLDTFALIDDSPFERAEVQEALPMVRVYAEAQLGELLGLPELDVPVTEASRLRRRSYRTEIERDLVRESYGEDYLAFLRSCDLRLRLFEPRDDASVARCLELVQRSNQLNLSKRTYAEEEFRALLADDAVLTVAFECEDRFGRYGIVGFTALEERGGPPVVRDFVMSCRVAQKRVEHALFHLLARREAAPRLRAELVRTERNTPLQRVLDELGFAPVEDDGGRALVEADTAAWVDEGVVSVTDEVRGAARTRG